MKITVYLPSGKRGAYRVERCPCCDAPRIFKTWKAARIFAQQKSKDSGYKKYKVKRI